MKIELFYFEGCPGHEPTLNILKDILEEEGVEASVKRIKVDSEELAKRHRFLGSPSIRVDGMDIEIEARSLNDFGQKCRIYDNNGLLSGVPSKSLIRRGIQDAKENHMRCG